MLLIHLGFSISIHNDDQWMYVEVEDNGPGVPEAIQNRIFEPFFTTREVGRGTGLGLSVSYFIITENHGGNLLLESSSRKGARFIVMLPISAS